MKNFSNISVDTLYANINALSFSGVSDDTDCITIPELGIINETPFDFINSFFCISEEIQSFVNYKMACNSLFSSLVNKSQKKVLKK